MNPSHNKVIVVPTENGKHICTAPNSKHFILLKQTVNDINIDGDPYEHEVFTRIFGDLDYLNSLNWKPNQELPGQLIILESLSPINEEDSDFELKIADSSGVICKIKNQSIFRNILYTLDFSKTHHFLEHDNHEEIFNAFERIASAKHVDDSNKHLTGSNDRIPLGQINMCQFKSSNVSEKDLKTEQKKSIKTGREYTFTATLELNDSEPNFLNRAKIFIENSPEELEIIEFPIFPVTIISLINLPSEFVPSYIETWMPVTGKIQGINHFYKASSLVWENLLKENKYFSENWHKYHL